MWLNLSAAASNCWDELFPRGGSSKNRHNMLQRGLHVFSRFCRQSLLKVTECITAYAENIPLGLRSVDAMHQREQGGRFDAVGAKSECEVGSKPFETERLGTVDGCVDEYDRVVKRDTACVLDGELASYLGGNPCNLQMLDRVRESGPRPSSRRPVFP